MFLFRFFLVCWAIRRSNKLLNNVNQVGNKAWLLFLALALALQWPLIKKFSYKLIEIDLDWSFY